MKTKVIVACDRKYGIGKDNGIPFKSDLAYFKEQTVGKVVIMGRKTWESLGDKSPLPDRVNIIVSNELPHGRWYKIVKGESLTFHVVSSLDKALELCEAKYPSLERYIIGGVKLYKDSIDAGLVDEVLVTRYNQTYECDRFFPFTFQDLEKSAKKWKIMDTAEDGSYVRVRYELK